MEEPAEEQPGAARVAEAAATRRAIDIIERLAEQYEQTAVTTATTEIEFVAKEIANALRRCAAAVGGNPSAETSASQMKTFFEKQPTKPDLSDRILDV